MMSDINKLLEKYWEGETTLDEEKIIKKHFSKHDKSGMNALFSYFEQQKSIQYQGQFSIPVMKKPKLIKMNLIRRIAVAASIILVLSIGGYVGTKLISTTKNSFAKNEIKDPDKAREIAENALAMLASNYVKGEESLTKSLKSLDKANIINSFIKTN